VETGEDWLDGDVRDAEVVLVPEGQKAEALEFARLFLCFVDDARGRALLDHWEKTLRRRRIPVNAPHTEYAAVEAVRDFIESIHRYIEFAQNEGMTFK
jgi:hypothetical protein